MRRLGALLLVLVALAAPLAGDEESARYFTDRGRKALADENWEEAAKNFHKALVEKVGYIPALLGLAETELGRGDETGAVTHLESCLEQGTLGALSPEEQESLENASELFKKLDRPRYEYRKLVSDYVARLLALARQHKTKSPELARRCLERVSKVFPEHPEAKALRTEVGTTASTPKACEGETPLLNGKDLTGWSGGPPVWKVEDGNLVVRVGDGARWMRHTQELRGSYTILYEMKITRDTGEHPLVSLAFGLYGPYEYWSLNVFRGSLVMSRSDGEDKREKIHRVEFYELKGGFDRQVWNSVRVCVKDGSATVMVNDRKFHEHRPEGRSFDGYVGLVVQDCTAEFRRISLLK